MIQKSHPWAFKFIPQEIKSDEAKAHLAEIRSGFKQLAALLDERMPKGTWPESEYREKTLHHLETAAMFATKGFTHG